MCEETPHSRAAGFLLRQVFDLLAVASMDEVAPDVCELQRHRRLIQVQEQRGFAVCRRFLVEPLAPRPKEGGLKGVCSRKVVALSHFGPTYTPVIILWLLLQPWLPPRPP